MKINTQNINYKQVNKYLAWGLLPLLFIIYKLSISNTIALLQENRQLETSLNTDQSPAKTAQIQADAKHIDELFANYVADAGSDREHILALIGEFCHLHHLLVYKVPETSVYETNSHQVETFEFAVQGGYLNMVKLVNFLEKQEKIGKIASVKFENLKDLNTKRNLLIGHIYLQRILVDDKLSEKN